MDLEYVTHASLYLKSSTESILTDPFYFFDEIADTFLRHFPPREIRPDSFGQIDYVYSSHIHLDHSHPETLEKMRDYIGTVLLPAERPSLERRYRSLGFNDIILLENGETQRLSDKLEVTSFWSDAVDSALVIQMEGTTVLHQNDCCLTPDVIEMVKQRFDIDYAFLWYTSSQSLLPFILPRPMDELRSIAQEREDRSFEDQVACIDTLRPRVVIPYSMTMTHINEDQISLNGVGRFTPVTFKQRLAEYRPEQACWIMQPGDVIDTKTGDIRHFTDKDYWGQSLEEYIENIRDYSISDASIPGEFIRSDKEEVRSEVETHFKARVKKPFAPHLQGRIISLCIQDNDVDKLMYYLDTEHERLITDPDEVESAPFFKITMPGKVAQWLIRAKWDPFHILFSRRIHFSFNTPLTMEPKDETLLYIYSLVSLFDYDLQLDPSEVTRLLEASRIDNVTHQVAVPA